MPDCCFLIESLLHVGSQETPGVSTNIVEDDIVSPLEQECAKARAVLNANIGACHLKLVESQTFISIIGI